MAYIEGEGWYFETTEWWAGQGDQEVHYSSEPTQYEMEWAAHTMTGHIVWYDEDGNMTHEKYFQMESDDGWTEGELEAEVEDAVSHYELAAG